MSCRTKRQQLSISVVLIVWVALNASVLAQGLLPTPDDEYTAVPRYSATRSSELVAREVDGQTVYEVRIVEGPLPDLPPSMMLTNFTPAPSRQQFNDCVGWAVAYCSLTTQFAEARSRANPSMAVDRFSPRFVYSQINNDVDNGSYIYRSDPSKISAVSLLQSKGCASEATTPYDTSSNGWASKPNARGLNEAKNYVSVFHTKCETVDDIRYSLVFGVPVVIAVWTDPGFHAFSGGGNYEWEGGKDGAHAMCIVGYDNVRQAFLIQNSWGTGWGDNGRLWVSYSAFSQLNTPQRLDSWCYEAHAIIADASRRTQVRRTTEPARSFFFMPNGAIKEQGAAGLLVPPNSFRAAEATGHFLYGLRPGGRIDGLDGATWYDVTSGAFPSGFSGGQAKMIAASKDYLYAITQAGSVAGRVPRKFSSTGRSYWELINLPTGEYPIDVRFRDGNIYVASDDGDVFRRIPGDANGGVGTWVREN